MNEKFKSQNKFDAFYVFSVQAKNPTIENQHIKKQLVKAE